MQSESYISLIIPDWKTYLLLIYKKTYCEFYNIIFLMIIFTHLRFIHHPTYIRRPWCFINAQYFHLEVKICHTVPTVLYSFMQEQQLDQQELFHTSSHDGENRNYFWNVLICIQWIRMMNEAQRNNYSHCIISSLIINIFH